jgi:hypothetical protein
MLRRQSADVNSVCWTIVSGFSWLFYRFKVLVFVYVTFNVAECDVYKKILKDRGCHDCDEF